MQKKHKAKPERKSARAANVRKRKPNASEASQDNPEWTEKEFKTSRPAHEVLPEIFSKEMANTLLKKRGRPKKVHPKISTTIRFDADVVEAFRAKGRGWQARMNDALREWLATH